MGFDFSDPFGILDFAKEQYGANRDYGHTREVMDSQNMFAERMSSTAYQRAVLDMKAAGLNPMLAYQQGGAHSPGGQQAPVFNRGNSSAGSIHTAAQVQNVRAQTDLTNAQRVKVEAETPGARATSSRLEQELKDAVPWQIAGAEMEFQIKEAAAFMAQVEANVAGGKSNQTGGPEVREYFMSKFKMLPVELRLKMADIAFRRLRSNVSSLADKGVEGVKKFAEYAGETLGKVTNSAVDAGRSLFRRYEGYQRDRRKRGR